MKVTRGSGRSLAASLRARREARLSPQSAVLVLGAGCALSVSGSASAQGTSVINTYTFSPDSFSTLVTPALSPDYTRGHNVSALEEWQPDYAPPGAPIGSFVLHPQATLGVVADNNVYANDANRKADISTVLKPSAMIQSDWSRHMLQLQVSGDFRRYATQLPRNQNSWSVQPAGEINLGKNLVVHLEAQAGRYYESPFSSDLNPQDQVLSNFFGVGGLAKVTYNGGRSRFTFAYDHEGFDFATLRFQDGTTTDQRYRNRAVNRISAQGEYGISPSLAVFVAAAADKTHYTVGQNAVTPPLSSTGQNFITGISFDLTGVMRGSVGVGYSHRDYDASSYKGVGAFSAQFRVDFFPYRLTTVSLLGQRLIQDSGLGSTPYVDTRITAEVDQSLRRNLFLIGTVSAARQSYSGISQSRSLEQVQATLRYQASRWLGFQAEASYKTSKYASPVPNVQTGNYSDATLGLSVTVRR
ncbi:outer membrane beta-barrel protein [Novosphingobium rosa]|uniref:outer membrane beta-barrel protein n=1 Tax=Novosphingobium rosa TaxID=76978 RepID=UPI0014709F49|nr:outer membrane beta-barrel protein [Novosphingobium rosa]